MLCLRIPDQVRDDSFSQAKFGSNCVRTLARRRVGAAVILRAGDLGAWSGTIPFLIFPPPLLCGQAAPPATHVAAERALAAAAADAPARLVGLHSRLGSE